MGNAKSIFSPRVEDTDVENPENQKVVVFAGSSTENAGLSYALFLANDAQARFKVIVTESSYQTSQELLTDARLLKHLNQTLFILQMDISSEESVREVLGKIVQDGRIDALVISSEIRISGPLESQTIAQAKASFEANVFSVMLVTKCVLPVLKKQGFGRIVTLSSQAGITGLPFYAVYSACKFAVEGFMESVAAECLLFNIHVSLLETSLAKGVEKTAQTLQITLGSQGEGSNIDAETTNYYEKSAAKFKRSGSVKKINPNKIGESLRHIILEEKPHFRYQVNKACKEAAKEKFVNVHCDQIIAETAERYLGLEEGKAQEYFAHHHHHLTH